MRAVLRKGAGGAIAKVSIDVVAVFVRGFASEALRARDRDGLKVFILAFTSLRNYVDSELLDVVLYRRQSDVDPARLDLPRRADPIASPCPCSPSLPLTLSLHFFHQQSPAGTVNTALCFRERDD